MKHVTIMKHVVKETLRCLTLGLTLLIIAARTANADAAGDYLRVRQSLRAAPLPAVTLLSASQTPATLAGGVFEMTAHVGGLVTAGADKTVLLSVGNESLAVRVPNALRGVAWMDSGFVLRVLLRVEPRGNETSLANLRLLAAAPEADIALAEHSNSLPRSRSLTSRSLSGRPLGGASRTGVGTSSSPASSASHGMPQAVLSARALKIFGPYRDAVRRLNRRLSDADVDLIATWVLKASDAYNVDPRLVVAMIIAESDFDIHSTSRTGAMGLGQLMPETARGLGVTNAYDPAQNIAASVKILRGHLDQYGGAPFDGGMIPPQQIALTMAAYNAGPGAVKKYKGVPPYKETQKYVARVTALYQKMCGK